MKSLTELLRRGRRIRVAGFDDAPFDHSPGSPVDLCGVICSDTRLEGMLWGRAHKDGDDATDAVCDMMLGSKFHPQVHLVLIDGLGFGGFNLLDLQALSDRLERPCVAFTRRRPDLARVRAALSGFEDADRRLALLDRAGPIHQAAGFTFQVRGAPPEAVPAVIARLTDRGRVPEALRLAHLIGAAVRLGESGRRA